MRPIGRWIVALASLVAVLAAAAPAHAIQVNCIEASRYKYIMRIFDNDTRRFSTYFGTDPARLPNPEACRAVLVTGPIEAAKKGEPETDVDRLVGAIQQGGGWLSTVYLASQGGSIRMGLRLGELTRMFWLNANSIEEGAFDYVPDFLGVDGPGGPATEIPPDLEHGWNDYVAAVQPFSRLATSERSARRCASACTYLHAAGVYRRGMSYFHRGRRSKTDASEQKETTMTEIIEGLQKSENRVIAFYRKMDAGDAAVQAFQSTASETTLAAALPMMPRYVGDFLKKQCVTSAAAGDPRPRTPLAQRKFPETSADLACIAASNARERLNQFAKLCPNTCDHRALLHEATVRMRALLPDDPARANARPNAGPDQRPQFYGGPPPGGPQPRGYSPGAYPGMR